MHSDPNDAYTVCFCLLGKQAKRLTQSRLSTDLPLAALTKLLKALTWRVAGVFNVPSKVSSNSNRVTPAVGWNVAVSRRAFVCD